MHLWETHNPIILAASAVIVYSIQTGLILFLYKFIVKDNMVARIWRDEDLIHDAQVDINGRHVHDDNNGPGAVGAGAHSRPTLAFSLT